MHKVLGIGLLFLVGLGGFAIMSSNARPNAAVHLSPSNHAISTPIAQTNNHVNLPAPTAIDVTVEHSAATDTILSPPSSVQPPITPGTKAQPQTELDQIIQIVGNFAAEQEAHLLNQAGWLHIKQQRHTPEAIQAMQSDIFHIGPDKSVPTESIIPSDPIFESWYRLDGTGRYNEGMGLVTSAAGGVNQQSLLVDGRWLNLTTRTSDYRRKQLDFTNYIELETGALPVSSVRNRLVDIQSWINDGGNPNYTVMAYAADGRYTILIEERYDPPIDDAVFMPEPVIAGQSTYVFEQDTGKLLTSETKNVLQSGAEVVLERLSYFPAEIFPELPATVAQLYELTLNTIVE